jgi:hypothetical protein
MNQDLLDHEGLAARLRRVPCPYKLYPARLRALETLTGEDFLTRISESITLQIAGYGSLGRKYQFQRDLDTYGLLEAIAYLRESGVGPAFLEEVCGVYDVIARAYMENHRALEESDDPRIQAQLATLREFGDTSEHAMPGVTFPPFERPESIPPPKEPELDPEYEPRLPVHPTAALVYRGDLFPETDLFPEAEGEQVGGSLPGELIGQLFDTFTFDGFPGIQSAFLGIARTLVDHDLDPFSPEGQYVLQTICTALDEEMFGDYDRWLYCSRCGAEMRVKPSLARVNAYLAAGGWWCEKCSVR